MPICRGCIGCLKALDGACLMMPVMIQMIDPCN